jgi:transketolase
VLEIDGHDLDQILEADAKARETKGRPTLVVANTVKGKGVSFMEGKVDWHGVAPKPEQVEQALAELAN